jgi:hypothetical protein
MALNFPDNPSDGDIATVGSKEYTYSASKNAWNPNPPSVTNEGVPWTLINSSTTLISGTRNLIDTSASAITLTLPASPVQGDEITIMDGSGDASVNNITVDRNGNPIESATSNMLLNSQHELITLTFYDTTTGWVISDTNSAESTGTGGGGGGTGTSTDSALAIAFSIALG